MGEVTGAPAGPMAAGREYFTAEEAMGFLGRRYRATRAYAGIPAGTIGRVAGAYPATVPAGDLFGLDIVWEGLAALSPADEALGGRSDGFSRRDLFLVFTGGEHAGRRAMEPVDSDPEPLGASVSGSPPPPALYAAEGGGSMTSGAHPSGEPVPDVVDLDARRRAHHQELREAREQVVVVLPDTEGELTAVLGRLEELLLADSEGEDEPIVDVPPDAAAAVGRLASYVGEVERAAPAVQPIAPDGRYELVPLHTLVIGRDDLQHILGAIARLPLASADTLSGWFGGEKEVVGFLASARRLGALLGLPWDDDVAVLHCRLGGMGGGTPVRTVLSEAEYAAYQRVSGRILETWHAGDTLAPFLYRGR